MGTALNEVQEIYNGMARRQQYAWEQNIAVMTREDHTAMHKKVRADIEKTAQAAGVGMGKTACILTRYGMRARQETGLKELNSLLQEIREAKDCKEVVTRAGIATGYANAMCHFGLMSENELKDVIIVIGQAGEQAARRRKDARRPFWMRIARKGAGL